MSASPYLCTPFLFRVRGKRDRAYFIAKTPRLLHHHPHLSRDIRLTLDRKLAPSHWLKYPFPSLGFQKKTGFSVAGLVASAKEMVVTGIVMCLWKLVCDGSVGGGCWWDGVRRVASVQDQGKLALCKCRF
jgi:hypothetical protein